MTTAALNQLDRDVIESVLQMGGGCVLDFSDRTFSEFFGDFGVRIDDEQFRADGDSKARRLRAFLRGSPSALVGRVLAALLERRLLKQADGLKVQEIERYRVIVQRLGGELSGKSDVSTEADLLRRVFQTDLFTKLPVDASMSRALVDRMEEAQRCIEAKAYLSAVILCGSVLEGMCLGFGVLHPERANRGFADQFNKPAPQFREWKLSQWIDVLSRLGDLSPNVEKFGHALRDFRNYVHPAEQLAHRFSPDHHTARIGFQVVVAAAEDLFRAAATAKGTA